MNFHISVTFVKLLLCFTLCDVERFVKIYLPLSNVAFSLRVLIMWGSV